MPRFEGWEAADPILRRMWAAGKRTVEIAKALGVTHGTVSKRRAELGLPQRRSVSERVPDKVRTEIRTLFEGGLSAARIAPLVKLTPAVVQGQIDYMGLRREGPRPGRMAACADLADQTDVADYLFARALERAGTGGFGHYDVKTRATGRLGRVEFAPGLGASSLVG